MMRMNSGFGGDGFSDAPAAALAALKKKKKKEAEARGAKKVKLVSTQDRYFSSDEEIWESPHDPVINLFACGWLEDGRCGVIDEDPGEQQEINPCLYLEVAMSPR